MTEQTRRTSAAKDAKLRSEAEALGLDPGQPLDDLAHAVELAHRRRRYKLNPERAHRERIATAMNLLRRHGYLVMPPGEDLPELFFIDLPEAVRDVLRDHPNTGIQVAVAFCESHALRGGDGDA